MSKSYPALYLYFRNNVSSLNSANLVVSFKTQKDIKDYEHQVRSHYCVF